MLDEKNTPKATDKLLIEDATLSPDAAAPPMISDDFDDSELDVHSLEALRLLPSNPKHYLKLELSLVDEGEEFDDLVGLLLQQIRSLPGRNPKTNKTKELAALRVVTANLLKNSRPKQRIPLSYSRGNGAYKKSRYNPLDVGKKPLLRVIDSLGKLGLVLTFNGSNIRSKSKAPMLSRLLPTQEFRSLIRKYHHQTTRFRREGQELVRLKDVNKNLIDYEDDEDTIEMRRLLSSYNNLLSSSEITLNSSPDPYAFVMDEGVYDLTDPYAYRSFSRGSFELGGRIYGPWWQNVPGNYRRDIKINGNDTVELDFRSLHLTIAYSQKGIDPSSVSDGADLYELAGFPRETVKPIFPR